MRSTASRDSKRPNEKTYDLIITDYNMPNMNGAQFTNAVRTRSIQPETPIMMITSEEDQDMILAAENAGVSAICGKPFETKKNPLSGRARAHRLTVTPHTGKFPARTANWRDR